MAGSTGYPMYGCRNCRNPVALRDDLLSKAFVVANNNLICFRSPNSDFLFSQSDISAQAKSGQAYMFAHAMNVVLGHKTERELITGLFAVCEIYCSNCGEELGWKYIRAYDARQRFKEGKFIIEKAKILKEY